MDVRERQRYPSKVMLGLVTRKTVRQTVPPFHEKETLSLLSAPPGEGHMGAAGQPGDPAGTSLVFPLQTDDDPHETMHEHEIRDEQKQQKAAVLIRKKGRTEGELRDSPEDQK